MAGWIICLVLAAIAFTIGIRSFLGKGFLFNNAYLWASEQERKAMDKQPYYRQSAIVFCMLGIVFLALGLASILHASWLFFLAIVTTIAVVIYAVASSIAIEARKKSHKIGS